MLLHNVRDGLDKHWVVIGGGTSSDSLGPNLLPNVMGIFNIQFVKGFNVIAHKSDGNQEQVLVASLD